LPSGLSIQKMGQKKAAINKDGSPDYFEKP
jgi:hypothetical protein